MTPSEQGNNRLNDVPTGPTLGRVLRYHSNYYYVEDTTTVWTCSVKGLLKKEGTEVCVGDWVTLDSYDAANLTARIIAVRKRKNHLQRPKIANVDQVLIVHPLANPVFDPHQLDRYLIHVELAGLTPLICISKSDLSASRQEIADIYSLYSQQLGYPVLFTSIHQPESLQKLKQWLSGKVSVLAGLSGAGKSSLLNALSPGLRLAVQEVSKKTVRGQHTTRTVALMPLWEEEAFQEKDKDTLVADTPGFSNLPLDYVLPHELGKAFREFQQYQKDCEYKDCLHTDETGCAILMHLHELPKSRYESYLAMLEEAYQHKALTEVETKKERFGHKTLDRKGKESLKILRLSQKQREASRKTERQRQDTKKWQLLDGGED